MDEFSYEEWLGRNLDSNARIAVEKAPYDAVFYIAAYHHADVKLKKDAERAWKDIKGLFQKGTKMEDVDWKAAYNVSIERILKDHGLTTYVDKYGAFGWQDENGDHFGDGSYEYPFYDEASLAEALK